MERVFLSVARSYPGNVSAKEPERIATAEGVLNRGKMFSEDSQKKVGFGYTYENLWGYIGDTA